MSGSESGGSSLPDWVPDLSRDEQSAANSLLKDPRGYIFGAIALWIIKNVFIKPSLWVLAGMDLIGTNTTNAITLIDETMTRSFTIAGIQLYLLPQLAFNAASNALVEAGLGAPIAAAVIATIFVIAIVTLSYFTARVILDAIPGGGAILR